MRMSHGRSKATQLRSIHHITSKNALLCIEQRQPKCQSAPRGFGDARGRCKWAFWPLVFVAARDTAPKERKSPISRDDQREREKRRQNKPKQKSRRLRSQRYVYRELIAALGPSRPFSRLPFTLLCAD